MNSASPVTSHTAAVSIERTMACLKNERSNHSSVIKIALILTSPPSRKNIHVSAQKMLTSSYQLSLQTCVNACSRGENVVSFGKKHSLAECLSQRCFTMGHSSSLVLQQLFSYFVEDSCQISRTCLSLRDFTKPKKIRCFIKRLVKRGSRAG